ncbi:MULTISPECIES: lipocalin family protein [unclassified Flavobacterium]|uniref:lipocalin family protein n=1 Tax=unclassified Flavobacterium TaxID=196869 RepID=UPI003F931D23
MNNMFRILFLSLFFVSCSQKVEPSDIAKINGYWQIEKVVFEEGEDKDYKMNESYDYFKIVNNSGIRKKVMPQLNGSFLVNDSYENVKVRFDKDKVYLDYATAYAKWSEELVALTDDELVLKNTENKEYHYKKAGPINLTGDGEETK